MQDVQSLQVRSYVYSGEKSDYSCNGFWNSRNVWFHSCFFSTVSCLPAVLAFCVLVGRGLRPFFLDRPKWATPFIEEFRQQRDMVNPNSRKSSGTNATILLVLSFVGLALHLATFFHPRVDIAGLPPAVSWTLIITLVAIDRPRTTPFTVLAIVLSLVATQLFQLVGARSALNIRDLPASLALLTALSVVVVIVRMPLRDPDLSSDGISPPFEHPTSQLRSPEDNLTLWQFMTVSWMTPLICLGSTRQLNNEDVWSLAFEFQHSVLHESFKELKGSVARRLLTANGLDLVIISLLAILESLANLCAPVLLQQLLRSMESRDSNAVTYAVLSLLVRLVASQSSVFNLWFSRRCYERSRGEMITMLYEKTLSRKNMGPAMQPQKVVNPDLMNLSGPPMETKGFKSQLESTWKSLHAFKTYLFNTGGERPVALTKPASMGKILNLMRNDVYEVAQRFWEFQSLITKPLGLILSVVLIWMLIGWPCLLGVLVVVLGQGFNVLITRILLQRERMRRLATDTKLQKITEYVSAIRHLRWYGWEDFWQHQILQARQHELNLRIITNLWGILIGFTNNLASGMFPVAAFYAYTIFAGQPLRIDIAFPALQLFSMLEDNLRDIPSLITVFLNARVAVGRIEDFMHEPNKDCVVRQPSSQGTKPELKLQSASFAWPGTDRSVLHEISIAFPVGLTIVTGKVGAGKTALLQALMGELDVLGGSIDQSNEIIGYCGQRAWLQSMSIKENILFSSSPEDDRYRQVLEACALTQDLASFKDGDLSNIGENGIGLSGGQKARVSLARAVFSRASLLLLDDPFAALDHQTAETVMRRCFGGPLLKDRTTILVTHRTELCHGIAQQVIEISEGRARVLDGAELTGSNMLSRFESSDSASSRNRGGDEPQESAAVPDKFMEEEHRTHGGVKAAVYWEYVKAGKIKWWAILVSVLTLYRLITVGETWFLKMWGEAFEGNGSESRVASGYFEMLPSPEINVRPWLVGFFVIAGIRSCMFLISQCFMLVITYSAGRQMFRDIIQRVSHATFRFYDVTPTGRLMNRLTSDIGIVDGNVSQQFQNVAFQSITWLSSVVIIAGVTPVFLVFSLLLSIAFVLVFLRFLPTSQSLRRLEMVSLSPLMSNFGALLDGLTTVRAFRAQAIFQEKVIIVTDTFQKMDHFYWSLQAWLMYRFDALSACATLLLTLLAIFTNVSAGLTAFILIAASQFVVSTHALCRQYGQLQMDFVSVERVVELVHLEQEPAGILNPPASWPSYTGDIVFEDVVIRYAPQLNPSLSSTSFRIPGGSTTALLGRTGSGKTTLSLALLGTVLPDSGRILIDGIDISMVDKQALRSRITFLAQDPVLFPGSMRHNLDPLNEYSNDACEAVLDRICGVGQWRLDTEVEAGGHNLSQGQRQLVGLACAVLRRSSIVILDEATASIDVETAILIQRILRKELRESTVITIAHRLEAVKNADHYIMLKDGQVIAKGPTTAEMMETGLAGLADGET